MTPLRTAATLAVLLAVAAFQAFFSDGGGTPTGSNAWPELERRSDRPNPADGLFPGAPPVEREAGQAPAARRGGSAARNLPVDSRVVDAYRARLSDQIVQERGVVRATLRDDNHGSRHQRLIVDIGDGHTVLIAHNIDLAPRVPVQKGDSIEFRGEYEWNEKGGVVHWTHHDPQNRHDHGWIEHAGRRYQ